MRARLIPLATWSGDEWLTGAGRIFDSADMPGDTTFVTSTEDGVTTMAALMPGDEPATDVPQVYEAPCPQCREVQVFRVPDAWTPKPVDARCIRCRLIEPGRNDEQKLIKEYEKGVRRGKCIL